MAQKSTPANDLLSDAVRTATGGPSPSVTAGDARVKPQRAFSLDEVLQEHYAAHDSRGGTGRAPGAGHAAVCRPVDSSLKATISEVGAGETAMPCAAPLASQESVSAEALVDALSGLGTELPEKNSLHFQLAKRRRLIGGAIMLIVMACLAGYWSWRQPDAAAPVGPAAVLQTLATAVEQHHATHHDKWPHELAKLNGFPTDAVEWPLPYWNARDAAGRTEIIWAPQGKHYRILLRQGSETWTVSDRERTPKLLKKGSP